MVKISTLPATNQEFALFTKRHRSFPALAGTTVCPAQIQVKKKKRSHKFKSSVCRTATSFIWHCSYSSFHEYQTTDVTSAAGKYLYRQFPCGSRVMLDLDQGLRAMLCTRRACWGHMSKEERCWSEQSNCSCCFPFVLHHFK